MIRFAATILVLSLVPVCRSQTSIGRLFFQSDAQGGTPSVGEFEWRPTPDVRVFDNPDLLVEPGHVERMYLYWEFHLASLKISGIDVDVRVSGDGTITGWHFYNSNVGVQTRWNGIGNRAGATEVAEITQVGMISVTQFGVVNSSTAASTDPHYNRNTEDGGSVRGTTLLGWVDLRLDGPNPSELFLDIGPALISRSNGPNDYVYFGFGDPAIRVAPRGNTSILFDARLRPRARAGAIDSACPGCGSFLPLEPPIDADER
ncbi:MAG: hypothetical protein CHACPFDD_03862 [Phycisphaerae bacterium]|nr:hypothetical protein [Phycisphaerae bacterium]